MENGLTPPCDSSTPATHPGVLCRRLLLPSGQSRSWVGGIRGVCELIVDNQLGGGQSVQFLAGQQKRDYCEGQAACDGSPRPWPPERRPPPSLGPFVCRPVISARSAASCADRPLITLQISGTNTARRGSYVCPFGALARSTTPGSLPMRITTSRALSNSALLGSRSLRWWASSTTVPQASWANADWSR